LLHIAQTVTESILPGLDSSNQRISVTIRVRSSLDLPGSLVPPSMTGSDVDGPALRRRPLRICFADSAQIVA